MNQFWDQLGTGLGDILINTQQPFGTLGGPPLTPEQRSPVIQQGLLSLGANILADNTRNPFQALGQGYNATRAQGAANQLGGLRANMDQTALNQNLFELSNAQKRKKAQEEFAKTLPPSERAKFEADPENYMAQSLQAQFAPQGGADIPADIQGYALAQQQGYTGSYVDFLNAKSGRDAARIPPGFRETADGNLEPIPGGPNDPKMAKPRALTSVDKNAILESDDQIQNATNAIDQLNTALSISDKAGSGYFANAQAFAARNDPTGGLLFDQAKGQATTEFNNLVAQQALATLRATFGGNPTEGERKVLLELQGSADKTPAERKAIIENAIMLAKRRLAYHKSRIEEIRGGTYFGEASTVQGGQGAPQPDSGGWSIEEVK